MINSIFLIVIFTSLSYSAFINTGFQTKTIMLSRSGSACIDEALIMTNPATLVSVKETGLIFDYRKPFTGLYEKLDIPGYYPVDISEFVFGIFFPYRIMNFGLVLAGLNSKIYNESMISLPISFGVKIKDEELWTGFNIKYLGLNKKVYQPELDCGFLIIPNDYLAISVVMRNLLRSNFGIYEKDSLIFEIVLGSYIKIKRFRLFFDIIRRDGIIPAIGINYNPGGIISLFFGLNTYETSGGIEIKIGKIKFNFAILLPYRFGTISPTSSIGLEYRY